MKSRTQKKLLFSIYGMMVFVLLVTMVCGIIFYANNKNYHDFIRLSKESMKMEGNIDYDKKTEKISMQFSFMDIQGIPHKRFISNNVPLHIFIISYDFKDQYHVIPKFDKFTGIFTLDQEFAYSNKNYRMYFDVYPKNAQKTLFIYNLNLKNRDNMFTPLLADKGMDDFDGTYRARFYMPPSIIPGNEQEISMRIFGKKSEINSFQTMNGETAYIWIVNNKGDILLMPDLAAKSKLTWHTYFESGGTYKIYVQVKIDGKIHTFNHVFNVMDKDITNENMELMRAR